MNEPITAQEIAERFGVELDDAKKTELEKEGNENEAAGADEHDTDNGEADQAQSNNTDGGAGDEAGNDDVQGESDGLGADDGGSKYREEEPQKKQTQDAQERHRQAAARREREAQERQEELRRAIQQARDDVFRDQFAGQTNPFTGKPITTEAEYRAFMAAKNAEADKKAKENVANQLSKAGIDSTAIEQMVKAQTQPIAQKMQEMQMRSAREQAKIVMQKAGQQIAEQIKVINAKYGENFAGVDDIVKGENGKDFNSWVQKGATLEQAYFLANQKKIEEKSAKAAYAAGKNAQAGKQHMGPLSSVGGDGRVEVPKSVVEMYRQFLPDATMEEIKTAYAAETKNNQ